MGVENEMVFSYPDILPLPPTKKLPLLGTIACGEPILAEENIEEYIDVDEEVKADFVLRCKGQSMIEARIYDGDLVYIHQQPDVENGEIAAVLIDNEATLKKVFKYPEKNMVILRAANSSFDDLVYSGSELEAVRIIGKAVGFYSKIR
jgi:repressor LexA